MVTAFAPMAFFFSAVYSESLYLALSVGLFWSARQGRWALVGVLGALAGATRSTGLVLALPALMLYLYGPREDRPPDHQRQGRARLLPRYRVRIEALWLVPDPGGSRPVRAGLLALGGGDALAPFHVQEIWGRHFAGPYVGVWDGIRAAFEGARQLLSFQRHHVYFPAASGSPYGGRRPQPDPARLPARGGAGARRGPAEAAPRLRGLRDRRAGAATVLSGQRPAADVAAALPRRAVPAGDRARAPGWPSIRGRDCRCWRSRRR